jgi:hypothetical protein
MQDISQGVPEMIQNQGIQIDGVPLIYSQATGKTAIGYQPWAQIITKLTSSDE